MSRPLPPAPPRHPSSRTQPPLASSSSFAEPARTDSACSLSVPSTPPSRPASARPDRPTSSSLEHSTLPSQAVHPESDNPLPPPKHPQVEQRSHDEVNRKLEEVEDLEIVELLDRVGDRLRELRITAEDGDKPPVEYPAVVDFRDERGYTDWASYGMSYAATLAVAYTPPSLVGHAPRDEFSVRFLRDDLQRLYVLCPPAVWQGYLLGDLARLYRWDDPVRTGKVAAVYVVLWLLDLVPLFPIGYLIYLMLLPRMFPPKHQDILAQSVDRASRSREAVELSKQLKNSIAGKGLGFAAEGLRGILGDLKAKKPGAHGAESEYSLATALGSSAVLGGIAASGGNLSERLRPRVGQTKAEAEEPMTEPQDHSEEAEFEAQPAQDETGEVSLYRLLRNLARSFGPPVQTQLNETIDLLEMFRNVVQHPDHPSSTPVLLRLVAIFAIVFLTPTWLRLKAVFGYGGIEFFVLWRLRELFPEYRRALMLQWWILAGAPTDAEYALYVLRKRGAEGRPLRGSKTIKRLARRSRASSTAADTASIDKYKVVNRFTKSVSDSASIMSNSSTGSNSSDRTISTYFALHRSVPGQLVLTSTSIRFVPANRLRKLGFKKLVARAAKRWDPTIELDESYYHLHDDDEEDNRTPEFDSTSTIDSSLPTDPEFGFATKLREIDKVKKVTHYRLPALELTCKNGQVCKFSNVSRRDDAFNKLLSSSAGIP